MAKNPSIVEIYTKFLSGLQKYHVAPYGSFPVSGSHKHILTRPEVPAMVAHHHRGDKVSGDYQSSLLGAAFDFDDPIDTFCLSFVTKGGRWYQRRSIAEVDKLYEQQKCMAEPEERQKVLLEMDRLVIDDSAYNIIKWFYLYYMRWNFVKGWTATPNMRSTNARMDSV